MIQQWQLILRDLDDTTQPKCLLNLKDFMVDYEDATVTCDIGYAELTHTVLSQYPGIMDMLEFASAKVETVATAVEKDIAEYETRIAKTFDGLRIVNDEYRVLTDSRERLTQASAKHARTLDEYRRLKAIMDNKQDVCDTSSTEAQ